MKKSEVKSLLMSMRTSENENIVNYLLGKIDMTDESLIQEAVQKVGGAESSIRVFIFFFI